MKTQTFTLLSPVQVRRLGRARMRQIEAEGILTLTSAFVLGVVLLSGYLVANYPETDAVGWLWAASLTCFVLSVWWQRWCVRCFTRRGGLLLREAQG